MIELMSSESKCHLRARKRRHFGNGPNTVSESTVSNTELSEFFCPHRVPGRELSEILSAYYLLAKANSPSFAQKSPSLPQNSVSSLLRKSTLETVCFLEFHCPQGPRGSSEKNTLVLTLYCYAWGHCTSVIFVRVRREVPRKLPGAHDIACPKRTL